MRKRSARGWPLPFARAHLAAIALSPILLVTGLMLYLPAWHTALIPYYRYLYPAHIVMGFLFLALMLFPWATKLWPTRKLFWPDWSWSAALGIGLVLTGVGIIWWVPGGWRPAALTAHGFLSLVFLGWLIYHARIHGSLGIRAVPVDRVDPERRSFLQLTGRAVIWTVGAWVGLYLWDGVARALTQAPSGAGSSAAGRVALPGFTPYTVISGYPKISTADWKLSVSGLVDHPTVYGWSDFMALPQKTETVTFQCVTGWSVPGSVWTGVVLADVLKAASPQSKAKYVLFSSGDRVYTESLPLDLALKDRSILLVHHLDEKPLLQGQGAPVRLFVPAMYGYKSIKWLVGITLSDTDKPGFWEVRGYGEMAWIGGRRPSNL